MKRLVHLAAAALLCGCAVTTDLDLKTNGQSTVIKHSDATDVIFRRLFTNFKICYARAQVIGNFFSDNRSATITVKIDHGNNITNIAFTTIEIVPHGAGSQIEYWLAKDKADWDIPQQIKSWASGELHACKYKAFSGQ